MRHRTLRWTVAGALLVCAGLIAGQPAAWARTQDRPTPQLNAAQQRMGGTWINSEEGLLLVIALDGREPEASLLHVDEDMPLPVLAPLLDGDDGLLFSVQVPDEDRVYLRAAMIDGETLGLWRLSERSGGYTDCLYFTRSPLPAGASAEALGLALEQQRAAVARARYRGELEANLEGIRTAERAYEAAFDHYLPAGVHPRQVDALDAQPVRWTGGTAFDDLGWMPDGPVVGAYQVDVAPDGSDFTVHGWADLDGDGVPAHWTASAHGRPERVSPEGVE
jgi:hypothetical protein